MCMYVCEQTHVHVSTSLGVSTCVCKDAHVAMHMCGVSLLACKDKPVHIPEHSCKRVDVWECKDACVRGP